MTRRWLWLGLILYGAAALPLLLIRTQPYDDQALRDILADPACSGWCFIGIQPDVTPMDEAATLLEQHGWVNDVFAYRSTQFQLDSLHWDWSGQQPATIDDEQLGSVHVAFSADGRGGQVGDITFPSRLPLGYWTLLLGEGQMGKPDRPHHRDRIQVFAFYPKHSLMLSTVIPCPVSRRTFWDAVGEVTLLNSVGMADLMSRLEPIDDDC